MLHVSSFDTTHCHSADAFELVALSLCGRGWSLRIRVQLQHFGFEIFQLVLVTGLGLLLARDRRYHGILMAA